MKKEVMLVTGAGQISMAIARRIGFGKKIILGDKNIENANTIAKIMNEAGYDVVPFEMDLSSRESILAIIAEAQKYGEIRYMVNGAGVSPSQGSHRGHPESRSVRNRSAAGRSGQSHRGGRLRRHHLKPVRVADAPADC